MWDKPDDFDPARFLNKPLTAAEYLNVPDPYDRDHFAYGAGRRVCPGVHVAERSLFINIARITWGFNILKKSGANGKIVEPETGLVPGFLTVPKPFECSITPRSNAHAELMRAAFAKAEEEGIKF
jgi:cytochrome P450